MAGLSLEFKDVGFGYEAGRPVLQHLELSVGPGLTLLVGPNGCGKSTLLKLAAGVEPPDTGAILVAGQDLWRDEVAARRHLAYLPEFPEVSPYAAVAELLLLVARLRGAPAAEAWQALAEVGLEPMARDSIRQLSKGQRRRVLYAAARIGQPPVLLLDEPLDGMDAATCSQMLDWIRRHRERGGLALVSTHLRDVFQPLADGVVELEKGRIRRHGGLP
jgi:ABC-type multidrug transport system ATPase subunit